MKRTLQPAEEEKRWCRCAELEKDLLSWGERGSVRRPVEDLVVRRETRLLRRWYREWKLGPHRICFCEFLRRNRLRGRRGGGSDEC